ncbi:helix-turn-helix domain-containing protein [Gordonia sp. TBRC 11910]|uniref:Helix-turn-helix domain-containing protein n=1 Tax=Gordonia asplenii TaxID=2725283 RepID=A0A848L1U9_9ACTN|nr:helix-turn-helix domain-containing protein [Gordonia asplenii]NMO04844.1 helix-turn-helix domain-containing protein [Gordonia asplenii]
MLLRSPGIRSADFDEWRDAISDAFVPLDAVPWDSRGAIFRGGLSSVTLGDLQLSEVMGQRTRVSRSASTIKRADPGVIKVALQLAGHSAVRQRDRSAQLGPGDISIYDTSERYELALADEFDMLVAVVPRTSLRVSEHELHEGTARTVPTSNGIGALLLPLLHSLSLQSAGEPDGISSPLVTDAVADLISAALRAGAPDDALGAGETILLSAQSYIEGHLGDICLSPKSIAAHHHVSVRYLQKLFAQENLTVAGYIRTRRLERCRRDLADPLQSHRSVGAICAANGIVEASHFSRLFKEMYGMSPRTFRETEMSLRAASAQA